MENKKKLEITDEEIPRLEEIKQWIDENKFLNIKSEDELLVLYFVRSAKLDNEKAKRKITNFEQVRTERIEWFSNRNPLLPELQELLNLGIFIPLEKRHNQPFLVVIRATIHDPKKHSFDNVLKCSKMVLDLLMRLEPSISKTGIAAILDMTGVQLGHALQLSPKVIKHLVEVMESYPIRVKLLEFINCPMHVNVVLNTFRLFMSAKMKSRLCVRYGNSEIDDLNALPTNIGGNGKSYEEIAKHWKTTIENNKTIFNEHLI